MRNRPTCGAVAVAVLLTLIAGCGSSEPEARQDILDMPPEELYGASTKAMLYEFRAVARKHGVAGAKLELPVVIENFEGYEDEPLGEHADTYEQIMQKLKSLETMLAGSPTREQVVQAAEGIGTLADKLPGEADPNPLVD